MQLRPRVRCKQVDGLPARWRATKSTAFLQYDIPIAIEVLGTPRLFKFHSALPEFVLLHQIYRIQMNFLLYIQGVSLIPSDLIF